MSKVLPGLLKAARKLTEPASADRLAAIEELAKKYGTKGLPEKMNTIGKGADELRAEQRLLEKADITPYDKRMQFLQQAFNRKLPAAAGVAGGVGLMAGGEDAQAAPIPADIPAMGALKAEAIDAPAEKDARFNAQMARIKDQTNKYAEQLPEAIASGANLPMGAAGAAIGAGAEMLAPEIKERFGKLKASMGI